MRFHLQAPSAPPTWRSAVCLLPSKGTFSGAPGFKTGGAAAILATGLTLWTAGLA